MVMFTKHAAITPASALQIATEALSCVVRTRKDIFNALDAKSGIFLVKTTSGIGVLFQYEQRKGEKKATIYRIQGNKPSLSEIHNFKVAGQMPVYAVLLVSNTMRIKHAADGYIRNQSGPRLYHSISHLRVRNEFTNDVTSFSIAIVMPC